MLTRDVFATSPSAETADCSAVGIVQLTPAAVIEPAAIAVTTPLARTTSGFGGGTGLHPPSAISTAPPGFAPPRLPLVNPPLAVNAPERFPSTFACEVGTRPSTIPATLPAA